MNDKLGYITYFLLFVVLICILISFFAITYDLVQLNQDIWELYKNDLTRAYPVDQARYD